jgi:hypothetical protein
LNNHPLKGASWLIALSAHSSHIPELGLLHEIPKATTHCAVPTNMAERKKYWNVLVAERCLSDFATKAIALVRARLGSGGLRG